MSTVHREDRRLLDRFGLTGSFPEADGGVVLAVLQRNANPSKIDAFLRRETDVEIEWDPASGAVSSHVSVVLSNDAELDLGSEVVLGNAAGAPLGTNVTDLSVVTPFQLRGVLVSGRRVPSQPLLED